MSNAIRTPVVSSTSIRAIAATVTALTLANAEAAPVTYVFETAVGTVHPSAPGFPAALAGVHSGTAISGTLTYDAATPSTPNPFSSIFGSATFYPLAGATLSVTIGTTTFDTWSGGLQAFVWHDEVPGPGLVSNGLVFMNAANPGSPWVQIGNTIDLPLPLSSDALPSVASFGPVVLALGQSGGFDSWLSGRQFTMTQVVPEPSTYALMGLGTVLVLACVRRGVRRTGASPDVTGS